MTIVTYGDSPMTNNIYLITKKKFQLLLGLSIDMKVQKKYQIF